MLQAMGYPSLRDREGAERSSFPFRDVPSFPKYIFWQTLFSLWKYSSYIWENSCSSALSLGLPGVPLGAALLGRGQQHGPKLCFW